jgi:hypothetical protein
MLRWHASEPAVDCDRPEHSQRLEEAYPGLDCARPMRGHREGESRCLWFVCPGQFLHIFLDGRIRSPTEQYPKLTLVLSISTLDLFMYSLLDFSLQDSCTGRLIKSSSLQNMSRIDPVVGSTPHNMRARSNIVLVDWNLFGPVGQHRTHNRPSTCRQPAALSGHQREDCSKAGMFLKCLRWSCKSPENPTWHPSCTELKYSHCYRLQSKCGYRSPLCLGGLDEARKEL